MYYPEKGVRKLHFFNTAPCLCITLARPPTNLITSSLHPQISSTDFNVIEGVVKKIAKEKQNFERLELTKEQLLEMFDYNPFKVRILKEKVDTPTTTVYRCGPLIDLCRGPHVRHTGKVKAFKVTKVYFLYVVVLCRTCFVISARAIFNNLPMYSY